MRDNIKQNETNKSRPFFFKCDYLMQGPSWYMRTPRGYISLDFVLDFLVMVAVAVVILLAVVVYPQS